jgi:hypothetical protein
MKARAASTTQARTLAFYFSPRPKAPVGLDAAGGGECARALARSMNKRVLSCADSKLTRSLTDTAAMAQQQSPPAAAAAATSKKMGGDAAARRLCLDNVAPAAPPMAAAAAAEPTTPIDTATPVEASGAPVLQRASSCPAPALEDAEAMLGARTQSAPAAVQAASSSNVLTEEARARIEQKKRAAEQLLASRTLKRSMSAVAAGGHVTKEEQRALLERLPALMEDSWREVLCEEFTKPYWETLHKFLKAELAAHTVYPPVPLVGLVVSARARSPPQVRRRFSTRLHSARSTPSRW